MSRVQGVSARICTWEVVTGFGQNLTDEELAIYFHRDFPEEESLPKFWKMISFNSAEGRRHRYLVILAEAPVLCRERLWRRRRTVPRSLFLFARADEQICSLEQYENFRYAAIVNGTLYVLVFYEGRLCHWSEERGYNGAQGKTQALKRLLNMEEFLRRDPLFSGAKLFLNGNLEQLEVDPEKPSKIWEDQLQKAARDPFWKGLRLEPARRGTGAVFLIILFFLVMLVGVVVWKNECPGVESLPGPDAPMLTPPAIEPISKEPRSRDLVNKSHPRKTDVASDCRRPVLEIRGIVGDRLFSGIHDGEFVMKKTGDSLGMFRIKSVLRDRVVLECGNSEWEVLNGTAR